MEARTIRIGIPVAIVVAVLGTLCLIFGAATTFTWALWTVLAVAGVIVLSLVAAALFLLK